MAAWYVSLFLVTRNMKPTLMIRNMRSSQNISISCGSAEPVPLTLGTRHGEKLYETLVTREEMAKAIDMGNYFRIPCDNRDLNYDKFFTEGNEDMAKIEDYHSHNTGRLDVEGMK